MLKSRYLSKCKNNLANSLLTLKPFRITVVLHKVKDGVTFQFCKHHYSVHVHCLTSNPPPSDFMLALVHTHCMCVCGRGGEAIYTGEGHFTLVWNVWEDTRIKN